jgi:hypothetical protein
MRSLATLLLLLSSALFAETLPRIQGENLLGKPVVLPDAAAGHAAVLIMGFSHASQGETKVWSERLDHDFAGNSGVTVYPMAILEQVPRLVRGMASHGIKSGAPKEQRERFLLVYHNEAELKQAAGYSAPDDAYVLLVDGSGNIRWRYHGSITDAAVTQLQAELQTLR